VAEMEERGEDQRMPGGFGGGPDGEQEERVPRVEVTAQGQDQGRQGPVGREEGAQAGDEERPLPGGVEEEVHALAERWRMPGDFP